MADPLYTCCEDGMLSQVPPTDRSGLCPKCRPARRTRDVAGILHFLTPQQMAEEIVRLDDVIAGEAPNILMGRLPPGAQAAQDVLAERQRQIEREGWDATHDDEHDDGSLALAAACYAAPMATTGKSETVDVSGGRGEGAVWGRKRFVVPLLWPNSWDASWWKPKDRRSNLVRAAALLLAEIERLDRAAEERKRTSGVFASGGVHPGGPFPLMGEQASEQPAPHGVIARGDQP